MAPAHQVSAVDHRDSATSDERTASEGRSSETPDSHDQTSADNNTGSRSDREIALANTLLEICDRAQAFEDKVEDEGSDDAYRRVVQFLSQHKLAEAPVLAIQSLALRSNCSHHDMREIILRRRYSLSYGWITLKNMVMRHESLIRYRWTKMNNAKRRKMLIDTLGILPEEHRPERHLPDDLDPHFIRTDMLTCRTYFWPAMNLEDLQKPKNFLLLLNTRARHEPHVFIMHDLASVRDGSRVIHTLGPSWLNEHPMLLSADEFPTRFGILGEDQHEEFWEDHEWAQCFDGGQGLLVLEIQNQLVGDLLKMAEALVKRLPDGGGPFDDKYQTQPEPPALPPDVEPLIKAPMLLAKAMEEPYRLPGLLDFDRLEQLIGAGYLQVRDHVWLLQEVSVP